MGFVHTKIKVKNIKPFFYLLDILTEKVPNEAAQFSHDDLKHVETKESNVLPTSAGIW